MNRPMAHITQLRWHRSAVCPQGSLWEALERLASRALTLIIIYLSIVYSKTRFLLLLTPITSYYSCYCQLSRYDNSILSYYCYCLLLLRTMQ